MKNHDRTGYLSRPDIPRICIRQPRAHLLILTFAFCILHFALPAAAQPLRIGLVRDFRDAPAITISSTSELRALDPSGRTLTTAAANEQITLTAKDGTIELTRSDSDPSPAGSEVEFASSSPDALISPSRVPSSLIPHPSSLPAYRGRIVAKAGPKGMSLVNVIEVDDYLLGVLPSEMPPGFNIEALKAQAVAARTYAWANRGKHAKLGYDLCDTTDCQLYLGASGEKPSTSQAVQTTLGLVAVYQGKLISAQYSADCGGATGNGGAPYLISVPDHSNGGPDYCEHDGHSWTKTWPLADLEKLLQKPYPNLKCLKTISVTSDASGKAAEIKLDADQDAITLTGTQFRKLLGSTVIRSTTFTVRTEDGNAIFEGKGFGHGIGLCQFGANALASPPSSLSFDAILRHYYTGVDIISVDAPESLALWRRLQRNTTVP